MGGSAFGATGRGFAATEFAIGGAGAATVTGLVIETNGGGPAGVTGTGAGEVAGSGFVRGAGGGIGDVPWVFATAVTA